MTGSDGTVCINSFKVCYRNNKIYAEAFLRAEVLPI